jgi:hypothetical protein
MRIVAIANVLSIVGTASVATILPRTRWEPTALDNSNWQIILSSTLSISAPLEPSDAVTWDLDLFLTSSDIIDRLKVQGKTVFCYFSSGTSLPDQSDLSGLLPEDYGDSIPDWPDERWLDLRSERVWNVMAGRITLAAQKGCDAIDPDRIGKWLNNMRWLRKFLREVADGYSTGGGGGFSSALTASDSTKFLKRMAGMAKSNGMSIGVKNAMEILDSVQGDVQFAVNEGCVINSDCNKYDAFIASGKPVFHIEYGRGNQASEFCRNSQLNTVIKNSDLDGWVHYCDGSEYTTATND